MPATRSLVIASSQGDSGKSAVAIGVIDMLTRQGLSVGVFRPISRVPLVTAKDDGRDHVLEMLLDHSGCGLTYEEAIGITYADLHHDYEAAMARIVARYHDVARKVDVVVVIGTDYSDVSSTSELALNAKVAANIGLPVLLVSSALDRSDEEARGAVVMALAELRANYAHVLGVVHTRHTGNSPANMNMLRPEVDLPTWVIPDNRFLDAPTVRQLLAQVKGRQVLGDTELLAHEVTDVLIGSMQLRHLLDKATDGAVVITGGDRTELLLGLLAAQEAPAFADIAGIILTGGYEPDGSVSRLVHAMKPRVPVIATTQDTYEAARVAAKSRGHILKGSVRKIAMASSMFERNVDATSLMNALAQSLPPVVTPLMFEYQLIERARGDRRRVVLPESTDDRILRAAAIVLERGIADLTLLGDEAAVRARAADLGLDLSAAQILSTSDSELGEKYAVEYTRLREKKGMTLDRAREVIKDVSYFGTMMVHMGDADGMVSGAAHTTAHTIRPSFETIKTAPGISSVSGIFLMCLEDRVLVYGDCAVIPDPTAEQLADVAIASAATATQFGIEPRIAMLSYSTGSSGTGADVDKVREATELVKQRRPDLSVEGPIQYDAAVDAAVAASKLPDSDVAGRATVFVFPDLNTGNNTYKAVQRSAGAVAIGPVLQGLNKPVNDLSRGALVQDIVNTVTITAIQAQGATK